MATNIGELRIELSAETASLRRDIYRARATLKTAANDMSSDLDRFKSTIGSTSVAVGGLLVAMGAVATSAAVGMFVSTITEFERLNASLKTMTGSSEGAKTAMGWLQDFAAETPYQLAEVVAAFTKLKALGLEPSREALESYGNTASALNKSLTQVIEAVADAATGQFERLRDLGITAKTEGDKVTFVFKGITTTVKKNASEIEKYLMDIGQTKFGSAMKDQMDTLNGALSNLADAKSRLMVALGDTGLRDVFKNLARDMEKQLNEITTWFKENPATVRNWGNTFLGVLDSVHASILRLGMMLDKIGGTMTFVASLPSAIPAALGVDSSEARMKQMAEFNVMYEQRYQEKERQLQELTERMNARHIESQLRSNDKNSTFFSNSPEGGATASSTGTATGGGGIGTNSDLKNQVALVKQIFEELNKEQQAAITINKEMYEQLGIGAENVAKDEVQALMERAAKWKEAGAGIRDINAWLYAQIDELRATWAEKGEEEAVDYLNNFSRHSRSLIDEYVSAQTAAVAELDKIGVRMDLLDKQDVTLDIYLRDHASAQINTIVARVKAMQAAGIGVETSTDGQNVSTGGSTVINNFNQKLSRSDAVNITTEQTRQLNRN